MGAAALLLIASLGAPIIESGVRRLLVLPALAACAMAAFSSFGAKDLTSWKDVPASLTWLYVFGPSAIYLSAVLLAAPFGLLEAVSWVAAALGVAVGAAAGEVIRRHRR